MPHLIHKDLSYTIRGVLFDVHNQPGPLMPERFYQDAVAIGLEAKGIACETEKPFEVYYRGIEVGRYFVDVWVEGGKLLLELKVAPEILPLHQAQAISYLKVTDADLAVVVNFGTASLQDKRLPNRLRGKTAVPSQTPLPPTTPNLVDKVVQALVEVHFTLGPGFLHQVYRRAARIEMRERDIACQYVKQMPVYYRGTHLGHQDTRHFLIEDTLVLATVAVKAIDEAMKAQLRQRLRRQEVELGIIANFNATKLEIVLVRSSYNE